jgi:hypothetical protein
MPYISVHQLLESNMTHPMTTAHELARREMATQAGRTFYKTYAACFADMLRAVYWSLRDDAAQEAKHPGRVRGFQIVEPARVWA